MFVILIGAMFRDAGTFQVVPAFVFVGGFASLLQVTGMIWAGYLHSEVTKFSQLQGLLALVPGSVKFEQTDLRVIDVSCVILGVAMFVLVMLHGASDVKSSDVTWFNSKVMINSNIMYGAFLLVKVTGMINVFYHGSIVPLLGKVDCLVFLSCFFAFAMVFGVKYGNMQCDDEKYEYLKVGHIYEWITIENSILLICPCSSVSHASGSIKQFVKVFTIAAGLM